MKATQIDLKGVTTAEEALEIAGANWEAEEEEMITTSGIQVPDFRSIIRSDTRTVIGVVGKKFKPIQNSFAFSFFDTVCQGYGANYTKAYEIDGGKKMTLEAEIGSPFEVRKGDEIVSKIRVFNAFDRTYPLFAQFSVWRKVCSNGLHAWRDENKVVIRHTKNAEGRVADAMKVLALGNKYFEKFQMTSQKLAQKILDKKQVEYFLKECFGEGDGTRQRNLEEKVLEKYEAGKGTGEGTAWDLYNGYCEWIDHDRSTSPETRLANSILGAVPLKEKAFDVALQLANS